MCNAADARAGSIKISRESNFTPCFSTFPFISPRMRENVDVLLLRAGVSRINRKSHPPASPFFQALPRRETPAPLVASFFNHAHKANSTGTEARKSLGEISLHTRIEHSRAHPRTWKRHTRARARDIRGKRTSTPRVIASHSSLLLRDRRQAAVRRHPTAGFPIARRSGSSSSATECVSHIFALIGAPTEFRGRLKSVVVVL